MAFKLVLVPKATNDGKHGAGFRKAKGHGKITLKCESQVAQTDGEVAFRLSVGRPDTSAITLQPSRGPVLASFFDHSCHGLPAEDDLWDFASSVEETKTFIVTVEIAKASMLKADPGVWWSSDIVPEV